MAKNKPIFNEVGTKVSFPKLEEEILDFWEKNKIFEKSLEKTKKGKAYVFYEGPPTANGKPHIGHVITRVFKDIFPRFKTMQGYYVLRKGGWDTHGLPVEVEVEKELGISSKDQIENIVKGDPKASIAKFNELCRRNVWKYIDLWEKMVKRVGHWIDLKSAYVTYERGYIESVWWSLKELFDRGLLYIGYKVVPYCTRCGTPLSSHELAQDYKETQDPSIFVKFRLKSDKNTYFLAWTTTPWTLPGNVALAIDPETVYVKVKEGGETLILAKEAAKRLGLDLKGEETIKGKRLLGEKYEPLYDFLAKKFSKNKNMHSIVAADFVDIAEGTGVVHTAVMYGEEDFELGKKLDLPMHHLVDLKGEFNKDAQQFSGKHVKEADPLIINDLKKRGLLWKEEKILHQYPFCWRCHHPLIYYALESWFIETTKFKEKLIKNNNKVNWVPEYIKNGRMRNWYETLIDWSISRNRYWGTPLPIWRCEDCDAKKAIGSFKELKEEAVGDYDWEKFDLHRPWVDEIIIKCHKCEGKMKRTPEVIDVWYDSGAMPFAQWHYPYENRRVFKQQFPADFISEAIDQTRGWFFSLQAVSTMLFGKTPYKNVVVFEHALDPEGKKMSKHLGNVLDPWEAIEKHGADAIRWFFFSSVSVGTKYRVSLDTLGKALRGFILPLWNTYNFFVTYANLDCWKPNGTKNRKKKLSILDKWILARLKELVSGVTKSLESYNPYLAAKLLEEFVIKDLSQWYVRRSRDKFGPTAIISQKEKEGAYKVFYYVLVTLTELLAPFIPFTSEAIYRNLTGKQSVHLTDWPTATNLTSGEKELIKQMSITREIVEKAHAARKEARIPVRQPLRSIEVVSGGKEIDTQLLELVKDEINVKAVEWRKGDSLAVKLDTTITKELEEEAKTRELIRKIQLERKKLGLTLVQKVNVTSPWLPRSKKLVDWLKRKTLTEVLEEGDFKVTESS